MRSIAVVAVLSSVWATLASAQDLPSPAAIENPFLLADYCDSVARVVGDTTASFSWANIEYAFYNTTLASGHEDLFGATAATPADAATLESHRAECAERLPVVRAGLDTAIAAAGPRFQSPAPQPPLSDEDWELEAELSILADEVARTDHARCLAVTSMIGQGLQQAEMVAAAQQSWADVDAEVRAIRGSEARRQSLMERYESCWDFLFSGAPPL